MAAFKSGERSSQIMHAVAQSLSDAEIAALHTISPRSATEHQTAMTWTRRKFGAFAGATCLAALGARAARSQTKARVVVIGGGIGGATVAKYLAASAPTISTSHWSSRRQRYTTCFFSNLYLAGLRSLELLTHDYETLAQAYGIKVIHDTAVAIDPVAKTVALGGGAKLAYDRAVVAPGIAFKFGAIEGYDQAATQTIPHAWNAGPQTELLRRQLEAWRTVAFS